MKYNDIIQILKTTMKAIQDPMFIANKLEKSELFKFTKEPGINNSMDNSIYADHKSSNKESNQSVPRDDNKSYHYNKKNSYYNKQQDTSPDPQGVIDSITQEITPVRLQQAIILSEIVGKPRSKTRKKRRF